MDRTKGVRRTASVLALLAASANGKSTTSCLSKTTARATSWDVGVRATGGSSKPCGAA